MSPQTDQYALETQLKRWIEHDPDPVTREHLVTLMNFKKIAIIGKYNNLKEDPSFLDS